MRNGVITITGGGVTTTLPITQTTNNILAIRLKTDSNGNGVEILGNVTSGVSNKTVLSNFVYVRDINGCVGVEVRFSDSLNLSTSANWVSNVGIRGVTLTQSVNWGNAFPVTKIEHGFQCNVTSVAHISFLKEVADTFRRFLSTMDNLFVQVAAIGVSTFRVSP